MTFPELEAMNSSWLRGFVTMHKTDQGDPAQQPELRLLLEAADRGYGTALSLKFQNSDRPLPRPGSPAMNADLARLDKVLPAVMDRVELLCVGNEPFLETRRSDRTERLNEYYEILTRHVIDYRRRHFPEGCRTHLFLGALNHLDRPDEQTNATARWLDFARRTPEIEGVDIHPHVDAPEGTNAYLDYVLPKLRGDQRILVTEFSLVLLWKKQLRKPVPAEYARRYGFPAGTPVWKAVRAAIDTPVPQRQWNDLCSMSPWYEQHKHFLRDQVQLLRDTGRLAFASYGIAQDDPMVQGFNADKTPWLFNSVFASKTVQPGPDGLPGRGYAWIDQFQTLQRPQDNRPTS
ncbi:hypothetical protein OOZ19_15885 [Saccharopolyspora sp. NFXS83]|uniref:hypothetical protein n=1 Tax=Saccharopolyspora sp. NFXS83 TaxID=2993560 RepID=UPI00224B092C|nr:hypothetical protein [Saccharopolyspora sp. NFXS83]MCX2731722.1 hypothetical protein [Saccharopolyspora sp. NFXS83]